MARSVMQPNAPGVLETFLTQLSQTGLAGFGDEINALAGSGLYSGKSYEDMLRETRNRMAMGRETNPKAALAGDMLGYFTPGGVWSGAAKLARGIAGSGVLSRLGRGGAEGLIGGTATGIGEGEGGINDRLQSGLSRGAAESAMDAGLSAIPIVGNMVRSIAGKTPIPGLSKKRSNFLRKHLPEDVISSKLGNTPESLENLENLATSVKSVKDDVKVLNVLNPTTLEPFGGKKGILNDLQSSILNDPDGETISRLYADIADAARDSIEAKALEEIPELFKQIAPPGAKMQLFRDKISDGMFSSGALGRYEANKNLILVSLSKNPVHILGHETMHALRQGGLFTNDEWNHLKEMAVKNKSQKRFEIEGRYPSYDAYSEDAMEEAIAEEFGKWFFDKRRKQVYDDVTNSVFDRMTQFFYKLQKTLIKVSPVSPTEKGEEIFENIWAGKLAQRASTNPHMQTLMKKAAIKGSPVSHKIGSKTITVTPEKNYLPSNRGMYDVKDFSFKIDGEHAAPFEISTHYRFKSTPTGEKISKELDDIKPVDFESHATPIPEMLEKKISQVRSSETPVTFTLNGKEINISVSPEGWTEYTINGKQVYKKDVAKLYWSEPSNIQEFLRTRSLKDRRPLSLETYEPPID